MQHRPDLELASVVLDGLGARCADRPGLTALSRVLGNDAAAAPAPSPASRGALEQLQRKPQRTGIGGDSRGWLAVGHGRGRYHGPLNHGTVTVRSSRMGILQRSRTPGRTVMVRYRARIQSAAPSQASTPPAFRASPAARRRTGCRAPRPRAARRGSRVGRSGPWRRRRGTVPQVRRGRREARTPRWRPPAPRPGSARPRASAPTVKVAPIEPPHATTTDHSASAAGDHHGPAAPGSSHGKIAIATVATATQATSSHPRSIRSASHPAGYWRKIAPTARPPR